MTKITQKIKYTYCTRWRMQLCLSPQTEWYPCHPMYCNWLSNLSISRLARRLPANLNKRISRIWSDDRAHASFSFKESASLCSAPVPQRLFVGVTFTQTMSMILCAMMVLVNVDCNALTGQRHNQYHYHLLRTPSKGIVPAGLRSLGPGADAFGL